MAVIPTYPEFAPISRELREPFEALTAPFPRYSDFDFTSLLSWDTDGSAGAARIGNNVVIRLPDYTADRMVCSVLGDDDIETAVLRLLDDWDQLELVPEVVVEELGERARARLSIAEDPDNHDYVFLVANHAGFTGPGLKRKRRALRQYTDAHGDRTHLVPVDLNDSTCRAELLVTFDRWSAQRPESEIDSALEHAALVRLTELARDRDIVGFRALIDGTDAGFSIVEIVSPTEAVWHFEKTISPFSNLETFLTSETSRELQRRGCVTANWEQDLGIAGLRMSKLSYRPAEMLRKFQIAPANNSGRLAGPQPAIPTV